MELPAFDYMDFKKFTDGKTIVKVSYCSEALPICFTSNLVN